MKSSLSLTRREKLLLGLLSSTLLFSFSFSYAAVNQSKADSVMQMITQAGNSFSSQSERDTYYRQVYRGLSDAIDMLGVVRNNVGTIIGAAPVTIAPVANPPVNTPPATVSAPAAVAIDTSARNNCPGLSAPQGGINILTPNAGWGDKSGNILWAKPKQPVVVTISVPAGFSTRGLTLPPSFEALTDSAVIPLNSIQVTTSTSPCGNKPTIPGNLGIYTGNHRLLTTDDNRTDTVQALRIVPGQVNYLMIWVDNNSTNRRKIVDGVVVNEDGNWGVGIAYNHWRADVGGASSSDTKYRFSYGAYFSGEASRIFPTGTTAEVVGTTTTGSTGGGAGAGGSTTGGIAGSPLWTAFGATDVFCPDTLSTANSTWPKASKWGWRNTGNTYYNGTSFPLPTSCTKGDEYLMREGTTGSTCSTYRCK